MRMFHHLRGHHRTWTLWPAAPRRLPTAPGRAAGRRARPALESLEGRKLLSLSAVSPNAGFPYTAIVDLMAAFPDGVKCQGTGVMVDSFHVLTAGHMLYSSADGGFASQILAAPELCGNSAPFGTASMTTERPDPIYVNWDNAHPGTPASANHDIGLITLNRTIGNSTGWMAYGYDNNDADFAPGTIFNTAGYPGPKGGYDGCHMAFSSGPIAGLSPDGAALEYDQSSITTYCGQSGSPVWSYDPSTDPERVVYAIHVAGDNTPNSLNSATRITQNIFNELEGWRRLRPGSEFLGPVRLRFALALDAPRRGRRDARDPDDAGNLPCGLGGDRPPDAAGPDPGPRRGDRPRGDAAGPDPGPRQGSCGAPP